MFGRQKNFRPYELASSMEGHDPPLDRLEVGVIQMAVKDGEKEANLERAVELVSKLASKERPPDVIVAPELFTTGYALKQARVQAEHLPGPTTQSISEATGSAGCAFVGSILERQGPRLYNTAFALDGRGHLAGTYQKTHLFSPMDEKKYLQPGRRVSLVHLPLYSKAPGNTAEGGSNDVPWIKLGLLLCYDVRFPELARLLARNGADLLVIPSEFPEPKLETWQVLVRARAIENQLPVLAVNRVGDGKGLKFFGHSIVHDSVEAVELGGKEETWCGTLDLAASREFRREIPCWKDRRKDLYEFKSAFDRVFR